MEEEELEPVEQAPEPETETEEEDETLYRPRLLIVYSADGEVPDSANTIIMSGRKSSGIYGVDVE